MTRSLRHALMLRAAALTVCLGAAFAASAQTPPPPMAGPRPMMHPAGAPGGWHKPDPEKMAARMRDVLQLTPAQEPALKTFIAAMRPPEGPGHEGPGQQGLGHGGWKKGEPGKMMAERKMMTTPERLDKMSQRLAKMQARLDATRSFYAALTPAQQKAFDALHPADGPMRGHRWEGRGHGPMMGEMDGRPPMPPMAPMTPPKG